MRSAAANLQTRVGGKTQAKSALVQHTFNILPIAWSPKADIQGKGIQKLN